MASNLICIAYIYILSFLNNLECILNLGFLECSLLSNCALMLAVFTALQWHHRQESPPAWALDSVGQGLGMSVLVSTINTWTWRLTHTHTVAYS